MMMAHLLEKRGLHREEHILYAQVVILAMECIPMKQNVTEGNRTGHDAVSDAFTHITGWVIGAVLAPLVLWSYDKTSTESMIYIGIFGSLVSLAYHSFLVLFATYEFVTGNSRYYLSECKMYIFQDILYDDKHQKSLISGRTALCHNIRKRAIGLDLRDLSQEKETIASDGIRVCGLSNSARAAFLRTRFQLRRDHLNWEFWCYRNRFNNFKTLYKGVVLYRINLRLFHLAFLLVITFFLILNCVEYSFCNRLPTKG